MSTNTLLQRAGCFFLLAAFSSAIYFFGIEYPKQAALAGRDGRVTQGTIRALRTEQSGRYTGYLGDIVFEDEKGRLHLFTANYPADVWNTLSVQQPTTVRYLASNPDYALDTRSYKAQRSPVTFLLINGGLLLFGLLLFSAGRFIRR